MKAFELRLFGPRLNATGTRKGLGKIGFSASDDLGAAKHAQNEFAERLSESGYARIVDDAGKQVWESKGWDT